MMDLKERLISNIITIMAVDLNSNQLSKLRNCLISQFSDSDIIPLRELPSTEVINNDEILQHFLAVKKVAGLSIKTLQIYKYQIERFFYTYNICIGDITTNHIRKYLAEIGLNTSKSYVDDIRRILNSFFSFCEDEEYVEKSPCRRVEKVKKDIVVRNPYNDIEIEQLRDSCSDKRDIALVDFLFSTGCRRDETRNVKISDIDFKERSVLIKGKGGKERYVYFSARCELHIKEYLQEREQDSEYLFCRKKAPYNIPLSCAGLASIVRKIANQSEVQNVYLHKFRRTFATNMINRGVALQDLKEMMGHSNVQTTLIYVKNNNKRIKDAYKNNCA